MGRFDGASCCGVEHACAGCLVGGAAVSQEPAKKARAGRRFQKGKAANPLGENGYPRVREPGAALVANDAVLALSEVAGIDRATVYKHALRLMPDLWPQSAKGDRKGRAVVEISHLVNLIIALVGGSGTEARQSVEFYGPKYGHLIEEQILRPTGVAVVMPARGNVPAPCALVRQASLDSGFLSGLRWMLGDVACPI